jgi:hypothetical protein
MWADLACQRKQNPQSSRHNSRPCLQTERAYLSRGSTSFRLKFARGCSYIVAGAKCGPAMTTLVESPRVRTSMIVSWPSPSGFPGESEKIWNMYHYVSFSPGKPPWQAIVFSQAERRRPTGDSQVFSTVP